MPEEKMARLIVKLLQKTAEGQIAWAQTETEGVYQAAFPSYAVRICRRPCRDPADEMDYILTISNEEGDAIAEVSDVDLEPEMPSRLRAYVVMKQIYDRARGIAMAVDQALNDILSFLEEAQEPGERSGEEAG